MVYSTDMWHSMPCSMAEWWLCDVLEIGWTRLNVGVLPMWVCVMRLVWDMDVWTEDINLALVVNFYHFIASLVHHGVKQAIWHAPLCASTHAQINGLNYVTHTLATDSNQRLKLMGIAKKGSWAAALRITLSNCLIECLWTRMTPVTLANFTHFQFWCKPQLHKCRYMHKLVMCALLMNKKLNCTFFIFYQNHTLNAINTDCLTTCRLMECTK